MWFFVSLRKHRQWTTFFFVLWTFIILLGCFIPSSELPKVKVPMMDKWVHFVFFAGFSFLLLCRIPNPRTKHYIGAAISATALGVFVELVQGSGFVRGRSYENADIVADAIGGLIGLLLFFFFERRRQKTAGSAS